MEWSTPLVLFALYVAGFVVGLIVMYEPFPRRLWVAMLWPLGIIAGITTVAFLLVFSLYVWPILGVAVVALIAVGVAVAYW